MLNRFLLTFFALCCCVNSAKAQDPCSAPPETITRLFHPDPGSFAVWQTNYGEDDAAESFASVTLPVDGEPGVVAAGQTQQTGGAAQLLLVRVDHRGQTVWDRVQTIPGFQSAVKILPRGKGYVLLARTQSGAWLGFLDADGRVRGEKNLTLPGALLIPQDMMVMQAARGWLMAVTVEKNQGHGEDRQQTKAPALYQIDASGNVVLKRGFNMGENAEILSLAKLEDKNGDISYIATGYSENRIGQRQGLVLRLDADINLDWQQEFPRGQNAQLTTAAGYMGRYILAAGDVRPVGGGPVGAWLFVLNAADGTMGWQRTFTARDGGHDYLARMLAPQPDGRITLAMAAHALDAAPTPEDEGTNHETASEKESDKERAARLESAATRTAMLGDIAIPRAVDYAHILTLNPRGITLGGDSYFEGQGARLSQLIFGPNQERILTGSTRATSSAVTIPRGFTPDLARDFTYGPMPLPTQTSAPGPAKPRLPEGELSEATKSGLALLNKKLKQQQEYRNTTEENQANTDNVQNKTESNQKSKGGYSENGWIVSGEALGPYDDPCRIPITTLPE